MKTGSITYNGKNSLELGVYTTGSGSFDAAELDVDKYEVAGRNGDVIIPKNRYKNIEVIYPAFIPKQFGDKVQSVRNWLRSAKVYSRLEDTYDMDHFRMGRASGVQSFEPVNRNDGANFEMTFDCKPQRFLKVGETPETVEAETKTASGEIASFDSVAVVPLTSAEVSLSPIQSGSGDPSPTNIRPISGHTGAELKIGETYPTAVNTYSVTFTDQGTVYGGTYDFVTGEGKITWGYYDLSRSSWSYISGRWVGTPPSGIKPSAAIIAEKYPEWTGIDSIGIRMNQSFNLWVVTGSTTETPSGNIAFELATPIEIDLTPTEVETLLGENNVWSDAGEITVEYAEPYNIENPTQYEARPLFIITNPNQGDVLSVSGKTITFVDSYTGTVTIDCETMDCYAGFDNMNYLIEATDFPVLGEGTSIVTWSGSGECKMIPRWWEL